MAVWVAHGLIELAGPKLMGNAQGGIQIMQRGFADHDVTETKLRSPYLLGLLADHLGKSGPVEEGLATMTNAITLAEHTGERYTLSELHRIKGEILLKSSDFCS